MTADVKYVRYPVVIENEEKEYVAIRYKEIVDDPLTEGKSAADLKGAVVVKQGEEALPAIEEVKYLATRICKSGEKYAIIASLRYIG